MTDNPLVSDISMPVDGDHEQPHAELCERAAPPSSDEQGMDRLLTFAKNMPYPIESYSRLQKMLDLILMRLVQCVKAKSFDLAFGRWDNALYR